MCMCLLYLWQKEIKLPSREQMHKEIKERNIATLDRYGDHNRYTIRADAAPLCDKLAEAIGCKPPLRKYKFHK